MGGGRTWIREEVVDAVLGRDADGERDGGGGRGIGGGRGRCHGKTRWWTTFLVGVEYAVGTVEAAAAVVEGALLTGHLPSGQSRKSQQWHQRRQ